ncbi:MULTISPECIES: hypothetical protein [unclassified Rhizobium]|uniref:hypothetical protein n=1 Tax=unclassified Rhizobium TaxID=2613769 RepID=UPI001607370E|nr:MULTISPECIES: hypothetical protein [unclassified Rhizobium]MBB3385712.1 hypothetical protein [Rhizobium sp. BK098]MBB3617417.1 hypothetical protein [Rhizobium sp. BK609]MBB3682747.1 hypothetical protein [Rhizobium sp. BK612]
MRRFLFVASAFSLLSSCYTVPDKTDFTLDVAGNYKAVGDCAWQSFQKMGGWHKTDLDSMNKVELSFGNDSSTAAKIDVMGIGPDKTRIMSYMPVAAWGKNFWPDKHRPIFEACALK